ncbi:MAG TPA: LysR substrate-binding domain-containing protein [Burkholderiaceae bacterium]|nr:LysR substrate-binding domain-containing protein [Burkholderiaceae bacterium]
METSFLQSFVLVAETGSIAEASRRLGVTPAAIAQQLRALERDLGASLVARAGRTVAPTPAGHRLLGKAQDLLREINSLPAAVREDGVSGELRLGTINTALHTLLPNLLGHLARAYPKVTVFIRSGLSQELIKAVRQDEIDAAICLHPEFAVPKSMAWKLLRAEPLVVLAPSHMTHEDPLDLIRREPFVRYDRSLGGGKQADRYLRKRGIAPNERFELSSLLAIALMVHEGLGVSLVPDIQSPLTSGLNICRIPLVDLREPRQFGVLWRRGSSRSGVVTAFLEQAR